MKVKIAWKQLTNNDTNKDIKKTYLMILYSNRILLIFL